MKPLHPQTQISSTGTVAGSYALAFIAIAVSRSTSPLLPRRPATNENHTAASAQTETKGCTGTQVPLHALQGHGLGERIEVLLIQVRTVTQGNKSHTSKM